MTQEERMSGRFGGEVVLGLLVDEPANCYQLDKRLEKRFGSAEYSQGTAKQAVMRLVANGLVRAQDPSQSESGSPGSARIYEPTPAGLAHFEEWMRASVCTPPVREELHAKIMLCQPQHLPRMIEVVREAEEICTGKLQGLNWRVQSRRRDLDPEDFPARMDLVVSTGNQAWWESRIKWLQRVRVYLEDERKCCQLESRSRTVIRRTS